ncbi:MAG: hypothetical protein ACI311_06475 [Bacilli bacterium]
MKKEKKETEIEEVHISDDPLYVAIEEKRLLFAREYNKQKVINSVILGVTFLALILTYIFLMKYIVIALIVMVALIIFTIVYSSMKRKKVDKMTNDYIDYFYNTQTKFVFNNNVDYVDVVSHPFEKLQPEEFVNGGFVLNVTHLGSRNSIYGQVGGLYFKAADAVARVTTNKVTETAFLGKYFMIQLDKEVNGKTLVYMGPEAQNGAGPNDLDGLDQIIVPGQPSNIIVWSSNKQFNKVLTKGVLDAIKAFEPNSLLEDICFCIKSNALYVCLSYTNDMMVLPLLDPFKVEPTYQYKEDTVKLGHLVKELKKAINGKITKEAEELLEDKEEDKEEASVEKVKKPRTKKAKAPEVEENKEPSLDDSSKVEEVKKPTRKPKAKVVVKEPESKE